MATQMTAKPTICLAGLQVTVGDHHFDGCWYPAMLHVRLEQLTPTALVLSVRPKATHKPLVPAPTLFNLSLVGDEKISVDRLVRSPTHSQLLTPRQTQAIGLIADGCTYEQTGDAMDIATETARVLIRQAGWRLGTNNPTHTVASAIRLGLIRGVETTTAHDGHEDLSDPGRGVAPWHTEREPVEDALDELARYLVVTLTTLEKTIKIAYGDERPDENVIVLETRGRLHVCQIRQPPDASMSELLVARARRRGSCQAMARYRGISERTIVRRTDPLLTSEHPHCQVSAKTAVMQMGLIDPHLEVHRLARAWCTRDINTPNMQAPKQIPDDANTPIFTTLNS